MDLHHHNKYSTLPVFHFLKFLLVAYFALRSKNKCNRNDQCCIASEQQKKKNNSYFWKIKRSKFSAFWIFYKRILFSLAHTYSALSCCSKCAKTQTIFIWFNSVQLIKFMLISVSHSTTHTYICVCLYVQCTCMFGICSFCVKDMLSGKQPI